MDRDDDRKITSEEANRIAKEKWNKKYSGEFNEKRATYDGWLDDFFHHILECETPILDLGCGNGNNARYLAKKGKEVIACDYSESALETIKENMPEISDRMCFDMRDGLPFDDNFTSIIIADLSLHYFTEEDTFRILNEIHRVLKPNGMLFFRVNSTNDINYGALEGKEIEYHYRRSAKDGDKRFFDKKDLQKFFSMFSSVYVKEETMSERYEKPKVLWRGAVVK